MTRTHTALETHICQELRALLLEQPVQLEFADFTRLRNLLSCLERYLPELLREHCDSWPASERLDGILPQRCKKLGDREMELLGIAILTSDQTETPISIRLRLYPADDRLERLICHLGAVDDTTGELVRLAYGSKEGGQARPALAGRTWMYTIDVGDSIRAGGRTTTRCDECESLYFDEKATMASLCPECAHQLYGYPRCDHDFRGPRCARCFWDGSVTRYLDDHRPPRAKHSPMKLIGSRTESEFRKELVRSREALFSAPEKQTLLHGLRRAFPSLRTAHVLESIPEQGEDLYRVLVDVAMIASAEVDKLDSNAEPNVEVIPLAEYERGLGRPGRIKLAVAIDLARRELGIDD